jgi:hypothetical protein
MFGDGKTSSFKYTEASFRERGFDKIRGDSCQSCGIEQAMVADTYLIAVLLRPAFISFYGRLALSRAFHVPPWVPSFSSRTEKCRANGRAGLEIVAPVVVLKRDAGHNPTSIREMRFNDGFWLLKHGVKSYYGLQATQVKEKDGAFELLVATRPIRHRGDTLGGARMRWLALCPVDTILSRPPAER